jgi:hypothetical protein
MRMLKLQGSSPLLVSTLALSTLVLVLPGCNVRLNKDSDGREKKVDIQTPIGGLHVSKEADVRDTGLPVYPGARKKEKGNDGDEHSANINISSSMFGLKVVAVEYVSDDAPEKLIAYYSDQLKKYGDVLVCHSEKGHASATYSGDDGDQGSKPKCEGDNQGKVVELKVGNKQNQHIVSIHPADSGKGSDFGLVYLQMRGGKDKI